jgi:hypothetical protein
MILGIMGLKTIDLTVRKAGWYIRSWVYDGPLASLEPFKHCPWCSKKPHSFRGYLCLDFTRIQYCPSISYNSNFYFSLGDLFGHPLSEPSQILGGKQMVLIFFCKLLY